MYVTGNRNAARKGGKRMAEILADLFVDLVRTEDNL
jgi:hypothetical protein